MRTEPLNIPLSGCSLFMSNRCCRPHNPIESSSPSFPTQAILRLHLVKLCQSPIPHLRLETFGYFSVMELPTRHTEQANYHLLQRSFVIHKCRRKEKLLNQNGSIVLFLANMAIESYFCCFFVFVYARPLVCKALV